MEQKHIEAARLEAYGCFIKGAGIFGKGHGITP